MRLVVDALAATQGGLATYVRGLLRGWPEVAPHDRLTIFASGSFGERLAADPSCASHEIRLLPLRNPAGVWRFIRTEFLVPGEQRRADALLATLPTIPVGWRKPAVIVVHDLRHDDRPAEFTPQQRLARSLFYTRAYSRANRIVAISQRVADDLATRYPRTAPRIRVALHGSDHVTNSQSTRSGDAIAFGHLANKEPSLLLATWKHLLEGSGPRVPTLHVIGLDQSTHTLLRGEAIRLKIEDQVVLDAYVPDDQLETLMLSASLMLLPSRHEGFGLPVLEAMRHGVPVVISPDRALREVAGGHAAESTGWSPEQLAIAVRRAMVMTATEVHSARHHADRFTWRRSAEITRDAIVGALHS